MGLKWIKIYVRANKFCHYTETPIWSVSIPFDTFILPTKISPYTRGSATPARLTFVTPLKAKLTVASSGSKDDIGFGFGVK